MQDSRRAEYALTHNTTAEEQKFINMTRTVEVMPHHRYEMDKLLTQIQDRLKQSEPMKEQDSIEWVFLCLVAFMSEALPRLRKIGRLIPRYEFQVSLIQESYHDISEATSIDDLQYIVTLMTNAFVCLFEVGKYTKRDWETEVCIASIVKHMQHQVQPSERDRVARNTAAALHLCSTFHKQLRLLIVRGMDRLVIYLQNNGFGPGTAQYVVSRLGIEKTQALARVSENDLKALNNMSDTYRKKLKRLIGRSKTSITDKDMLMILFGKLQELHREM
jgi:hypothetical protein